MHENDFPRHTPIRGRFRIATQRNGRPVALEHWRLTTEDATVADRVHALLGGTAPAHWPSPVRDDIEVLTTTSELPIILDGPEALSFRYIRRDRTPVWASNGRSIILPDGRRERDPDADLSFAQRRSASRRTGEEMSTTVYFRLADLPGAAFLFRSTSWGLAARWRREGVPEALAAAGPNAGAILRLSPRPALPDGTWTTPAVDLSIR